MRLSRRRFVQASAIAAASSMASFSPMIGPATAQETAHGLSLFERPEVRPRICTLRLCRAECAEGRYAAPSHGRYLQHAQSLHVEGCEPRRALASPSRACSKGAADEPDAAYGLIAAEVALAPDRRSVRFLLRPEARWHDGTPVSAADVAFLVRDSDDRGRAKLRHPARRRRPGRDQSAIATSPSTSSIPTIASCRSS